MKTNISKKTEPTFQTKDGDYLITECKLITKEHIDEMCKKISEKLLIANVACITVGVDDYTFNRMLSDTTSFPLGKYAKHQIKIAEARREEKIVELMTNSENFNTGNIKILDKYLAIISPKHNAKLRNEFLYELAAFLMSTKEVVDSDVWLKIVNHLREKDSMELFVQLDEFLLPYVYSEKKKHQK